MSQEPLCVEIYSKNAGRQSRQPFCASLRSRNAHGHFTRAILCRNLHEKKPRRVGYHLDWTPGPNCDRKKPSVWPHCLRKKWSGGYVGHMKTMREILKKCVKCWIGGRNACKVWTLSLKLRKMQNSQVWRTPWFHDPPCWPFLCCAMQAAKTCEKRKRHCYTCHAGRSDRLKFETNPIDSKNIEKREVW